MNNPKRDKGKSKAGDIPGTALLSKAVNILECIGEADTRLRIKDLVDETGYAKPTLYRIISALSARGFVQIDPRDGAYSLGPRFTELAGTIAQHSDLISIAAAPMKRLADKFGETATLGVLAGTSQQTVAASHGAGVFASSPLGTRKPLHCTALGKALLAFQGAQLQAKLMSELSFDALTKNTIKSAPALATELASIRMRGFALDDEEIVEGVKCISVPILSKSGDAIAALSVSAPAHRMPDTRRSEIALELKAAAENIGSALEGGADKGLGASSASPWLSIVDGLATYSVTDVSEFGDDTLIICDGPGGCIYRKGAQVERLLTINSQILAATSSDKAYLFISDGALWRLEHQADAPAEAVRLFANPLFNQIDALCWRDGALFAGCGSSLLEIELTGNTTELADDREEKSGLHLASKAVVYLSHDGVTRVDIQSGNKSLVCPLDPRGVVGVTCDLNGHVWVARKAAWGIEEYGPQGALLRKLALPVPQASLLKISDRFFVGSERWSLSSAQLDLAPAAGSLFIIDKNSLPVEATGV